MTTYGACLSTPHPLQPVGHLDLLYFRRCDCFCHVDWRKASKQQKFEMTEAVRLQNRQQCDYVMQPGFWSDVLKTTFPPRLCGNTRLWHGRCKHHRGR